MFNFLKKKEQKPTLLYAPVTGEIITLESLNDGVFSTKMMGNGFAVEPSEEVIYSPVCGIVDSIFPTKHALGIISDNGDEVILHVGLDTVNLEGKPFELMVEVGSKVHQDTIILKMNQQQIKEANVRDTVIVVVPKLVSGNSIYIQEPLAVSAKQEIGMIK